MPPAVRAGFVWLVVSPTESLESKPSLVSYFGPGAWKSLLDNLQTTSDTKHLLEIQLFAAVY